jgi:hypothetical protein
MIMLEAPKASPPSPTLEGDTMVETFLLKQRRWLATGAAALTHLHPFFFISRSSNTCTHSSSSPGVATAVKRPSQGFAGPFSTWHTTSVSWSPKSIRGAPSAAVLVAAGVWGASSSSPSSSSSAATAAETHEICGVVEGAGGDGAACFYFYEYYILRSYE